MTPDVEILEGNGADRDDVGHISYGRNERDG